MIVLDNGRDPETGKRRQKWFSGYRTKDEAEGALVELLGKQRLGVTIDPDITPVVDYVVTLNRCAHVLPADDASAPSLISALLGSVW